MYLLKKNEKVLEKEMSEDELIDESVATKTGFIHSIFYNFEGQIKHL